MTRKRTSENDLVVSGGGAAVPARRKAASRLRAKPAAEPETVTPPAPAESSVCAPSHQEIAALAYSYWAARGFQGGSPEEDWVRAEEELRLRATAAIA